jgi:hypothetical protein
LPSPTVAVVGATDDEGGGEEVVELRVATSGGVVAF